MSMDGKEWPGTACRCVSDRAVGARTGLSLRTVSGVGRAGPSHGKTVAGHGSSQRLVSWQGGAGERGQSPQEVPVRRG